MSESTLHHNCDKNQGDICSYNDVVHMPKYAHTQLYTKGDHQYYYRESTYTHTKPVIIF